MPEEDKPPIRPVPVERSPSASQSPSIEAQCNDRDHESALPGREIAVPEGVASSGSLEHLVETARNYASQATAENTNKADWKHFSNW